MAARGVDLGAVSSTMRVRFDYFIGFAERTAKPHEVLLHLQHTDGTAHIAQWPFAQDVSPGRWLANDVSSTLRRGEWRETAVRPVSPDLDVFEAPMVSANIREVASGLDALRASDPFEDLFDRFDSKTKLMGVSIGHGRASIAEVDPGDADGVTAQRAALVYGGFTGEQQPAQFVANPIRVGS